MPIDIDGLSFEELLELNRRVVARLKMLESMQAHIEMMLFNQGQRWNIPPHLLSVVKEAGSVERQHTSRQEEKTGQIVRPRAIRVWTGRLQASSVTPRFLKTWRGTVMMQPAICIGDGNWHLSGSELVPVTQKGC